MLLTVNSAQVNTLFLLHFTVCSKELQKIKFNDISWLNQKIHKYSYDMNLFYFLFSNSLLTFSKHSFVYTHDSIISRHTMRFFTHDYASVIYTTMYTFELSYPFIDQPRLQYF